MINSMFRFFIWNLCLLMSCQLLAITPVVIDSSDLDKTYFWKGENLRYFADPGGKVNIEDILAGTFNDKFKDTRDDVPLLPSGSYYWVKIPIIKKSNDNLFWLFEAYDQSIDDIEFYAPDKNGRYVQMRSGELLPFSAKPYHHKNHIFELNLIPGKEQVVYLRVKDKLKMAMVGAVRNHRSLMNYALSEYFFLSLFYGLVLCMILVTLAYYLSTRQKNYLFYLLYLLAAAFFTFSSDGLGFQFIWSSFPYLNNEFSYISLFAVVALVYLLTRSFLGEFKIPPFVHKTILVLLGLRLLDVIIKVLFWKNFLPEFYVDMTIRGLLLWAVYYHYKNGNRQLRYFVLALTSLMLGYMLRQFAILGFIPNNYITVYMNLWGEAFQMVLITLALSEQLKIQMEDSLKKQKEATEEMAHLHQETDQMRLSLQNQVNEQVAREKFLSEGISSLSKIIASHQHDASELYHQISSFLASHFDFGMVAFYVPDDEKSNSALLRSGYGLDSQRLTKLGEHIENGLIGQCIKDKQRLVLENIPKDFISIESGLGRQYPQQVVIEPLLFNETLVGILEYASFHVLTDLEKELLKRVLDQISSVLSYTAFSEKTERLLAASKNKEDELLIRQEDLNQQIEELMTTQEELSDMEQVYLKEIEELKKKVK